MIIDPATIQVANFTLRVVPMLNSWYWNEDRLRKGLGISMTQLAIHDRHFVGDFLANHRRAVILRIQRIRLSVVDLFSIDIPAGLAVHTGGGRLARESLRLPLADHQWEHLRQHFQSGVRMDVTLRVEVAIPTRSAIFEDTVIVDRKIDFIG